MWIFSGNATSLHFPNIEVKGKDDLDSKSWRKWPYMFVPYIEHRANRTEIMTSHPLNEKENSKIFCFSVPKLKGGDFAYLKPLLEWEMRFPSWFLSLSAQYSLWHTGLTLERWIEWVCQAQTLSSYIRHLLSASASGDKNDIMTKQITLILNNPIKFPFKWFYVILEHSESTELMWRIRKEHNCTHQFLLWYLRTHF